MADRFANQWRIPVPAPPVVTKVVQITSPAPGDRLTVGSLVTVSWVNSDASDLTGDFTIEISRRIERDDWTPLKTDRNGGSFNWMVTAPATDAAKFRVTTDVGTAESGAVFIILVAPPEPPSDADLSLAALIDAVYLRLDDYLVYDTQTWTTDGVSRFLRLKHGDLVPNSFVMIVGPGSYTLDEAAGYLVWDAVPAGGSPVEVSFAYRSWNREVVKAFLAGSVTAMWDEFYCIAEDLLPTTAGVFEYEVRDINGRLAEAVTDVEVQEADGQWFRLSREHFRVVRKEGYAAYVKLFFDPQGDSYRVRYVTRPGVFTAETQTVTDLGLPARASEPMIYYALWQCLAQKIPGRVRNDRAIAADDSVATNRDIVSDAQLYQLLFQQSLANNKMRHWNKRGV